MTDLVADVLEFCSIPSESTTPERAPDVRRAALWLRDHLTARGYTGARLLETPGHPSVYAERGAGPHAPTVLIYGHFDVQPAEPLDAWTSPPYEPVVRDGAI
ncbi:hypothetical protein [Thermoactinospora rubra]|uniref:hypothetical protein n=1 Tax=Thermoactinospora rubra TaxID=1088767 RepID=UPI0019805B09|nr:hypothetical protein [Thermoactinospora rubra]